MTSGQPGAKRPAILSRLSATSGWGETCWLAPPWACIRGESQAQQMPWRSAPAGATYRKLSGSTGGGERRGDESRHQASRRSTRAHAMRSAHAYSGAWASQPFIRHEFTTAAAVPAFRRSLKACCGRLTANAGQHTCWPAPACTAGPSTASREAHRPHAPPMPPLQRPCPAAGHGAHMRVRPRLRPQGLRAILQVFELSDTFGKCSSDTTPK